MTSIDSKVQSLADKIYTDGVEKAKKEADEIVAAAKAERDKLLKDAQEEADRLRKEAAKAAEKEKETATAEIDMAAMRALEALKSSLADLINEKAVNEGVSQATAEPDKMYGIVLEMVKAWADGKEVKIATSDAEALETYFRSHAADLLQKGVEIQSINGKAHRFELKPQNGAYKLSIGQDELVAYFKEFFRPRLKARLFNDKQQTTEA